jgi:hypothetical protein
MGWINVREANILKRDDDGRYSIDRAWKDDPE